MHCSRDQATKTTPVLYIYTVKSSLSLSSPLLSCVTSVFNHGDTFKSSLERFLLNRYHLENPPERFRTCEMKLAIHSNGINSMKLGGKKKQENLVEE